MTLPNQALLHTRYTFVCVRVCMCTCVCMYMYVYVELMNTYNTHALPDMELQAYVV